MRIGLSVSSQNSRMWHPLFGNSCCTWSRNIWLHAESSCYQNAHTVSIVGMYHLARQSSFTELSATATILNECWKGRGGKRESKKESFFFPFLTVSNNRKFCIATTIKKNSQETYVILILHIKGKERTAL